MLDALQLGRSMSKEQYSAALPGLRAALLDAQARLRDAGFSVVVLVNGVDGSGKGETVNALHEWLDARFLTSQSYAVPTEEERAHPEYWRYWLWLPPAGRIGIFSGSWYTEPLLDRVWARSTGAAFDSRLARINGFERTLADNGTLIVKLWFHISKKAQRKRLKALHGENNNIYRITKQ
jgi:polyphosphate kinase 2 (PPK2 family)